jgi:hypothetical protein
VVDQACGVQNIGAPQFDAKEVSTLSSTKVFFHNQFQVRENSADTLSNLFNLYKPFTFQGRNATPRHYYTHLLVRYQCAIQA